jgi:micrococcal nuclease
MRWPNRKVFLPLFVLLFPSIPLFSHSQAANTQTVRVRRVVDGDTLLLINGERVRLIGVDTLEVHESKKLYRDAKRSGRDIKNIKALGGRSSAFTREIVDKKQIRLHFAPNNAYLGHRDKYGRILAYVFLMDGTFLNAEIIKQGYRFVYTRFPFKYLEEFRRYERRARESKRGIWGN